jgi:hypothetical protein
VDATTAATEVTVVLVDVPCLLTVEATEDVATLLRLPVEELEVTLLRDTVAAVVVDVTTLPRTVVTASAPLPAEDVSLTTMEEEPMAGIEPRPLAARQDPSMTTPLSAAVVVEDTVVDARTTLPLDTTTMTTLDTAAMAVLAEEAADTTSPGGVILVRPRREVVQEPLLLRGVHLPREETTMTMIAAGIRSDLYDPVGCVLFNMANYLLDPPTAIRTRETSTGFLPARSHSGLMVTRSAILRPTKEPTPGKSLWKKVISLPNCLLSCQRRSI